MSKKTKQLKYWIAAFILLVLIVSTCLFAGWGFWKLVDGTINWQIPFPINALPGFFSFAGCLLLLWLGGVGIFLLVKATKEWLESKWKK